MSGVREHLLWKFCNFFFIVLWGSLLLFSPLLVACQENKKGQNGLEQGMIQKKLNNLMIEQTEKFIMTLYVCRRLLGY